MGVKMTQDFIKKGKACKNPGKTRKVPEKMPWQVGKAMVRYRGNKEGNISASP